MSTKVLVLNANPLLQQLLLYINGLGSKLRRADKLTPGSVQRMQQPYSERGRRPQSRTGGKIAISRASLRAGLWGPHSLRIPHLFVF